MCTRNIDWGREGLFKQKIAVVTGGASGIGKALCELLAEQGATVIVADLNLNGADKVVNAIKSKKQKAESAVLNIADYDAVCAFVKQIAQEYGRIDYFINSAGIAIGGETWRFEKEQWLRFINVNLLGIIYTSTEVYKIMMRQKSGHIINISSGSGIFPTPMRAPYSTTKYGVVGFCTAFRPEAAVYGIKVSVVCPGPVQTPILQNSEFVGANESLKQQLEKKNNWIPAEKAAEIILKGIKRNKAIIPVTTIASIMWIFYRYLPDIYDRTIARKLVRRYLEYL
jgi:NAD(P)-dependent dehydrogenase (short-subunit alcohol dehydrogenase family)